jgi:polyhydroxybutyrate depolymerase
MFKQRSPSRRGVALVGATAALAAALAAPGQATAASSADPVPTATCPAHDPAGHPYAVGVNCRVVEVDGHPRQFIVYVPRRPRGTRGPAPLVFMFHGGSGTGEKFLRISGWREQADATGLIAVFPTALPSRALDANRPATHWNTFTLASEIDLGIRPPGYPADAPWPADDVGFADAMVADIGAGLSIDRSRVYASGFSNGAAFTARLAVERSQVLAAAAFSGGGLSSAHVPARPIPMYVAVGTLDDRVLAQTGPPPLSALPLDPVELLGVPVIASALGAHTATLGLDDDDFGAEGAPHLTGVRWPVTGTGAGGALLRFTAIDGLGHRYPRADDSPSGFAAAPEFWDFFEDHPLP